jgi:hypothetical protein
MSTFFLPQEIRPVTPDQARLTARHLVPALADIEQLLYRLRADIDAELASRLPDQDGKAYPYGRCLEISHAFRSRLQAQLKTKLPHRGLRAMRDFLSAGGRMDWVWGALREQYFQNAFQVGSLYVDVSNDTVTVTKPKIEILPLKDAEFIAIQGLDHFGRVAQRYWGVTIFVNDLVPAIAPIFPMTAQFPNGAIEFMSATDYMVDFLRRDGFMQSEAFLASGQSMPHGHWVARQPWVPEDLRVANADEGRRHAIAACSAARLAGLHLDPAWKLARQQDHARVIAAFKQASG